MQANTWDNFVWFCLAGTVRVTETNSDQWKDELKKDDIVNVAWKSKHLPAKVQVLPAKVNTLEMHAVRNSDEKHKKIVSGKRCLPHVSDHTSAR